MIVIDNFLNQKDYISLKNRLDEISLTDDLNIKEDPDHKNLQNSKIYDIMYNDVKVVIDELTNRQFLNTNFDGELPHTRYHITKKPYYTKFHRDSLSYDENKDGVDHFGVTIFFNNIWQEQWGGLYTYKEENSNNYYKSYTQKYIEPISNRCIINPNDTPHAVTKMTSPNKIERKSLQLFFNTKYFL